MTNELKSYVKDYMTKNVITVKPETPNTEVIQIMKKTKHDGFPVIEDNKEIVGIVTASDLLLKDWVNGDSITTVMSTEVLVVNENMSINETYTHEFGHVIINEINMNNPTAMNDIANVLMIGNDEVLADIIGNLVYQYEFGETPRDMTYVFANENDLNFVIDTVVENMMN